MLWYSLLMKLLIDIPILLRSNKTLLQHLAKSKPTPLTNKLTLLAGAISGKNQLQRTFQLRALGSFSKVGVPRQPKDVTTIFWKQKVFCREEGIDPISQSLDQPIEFLSIIFETDAEYSSVGTARSAGPP